VFKAIINISDAYNLENTQQLEMSTYSILTSDYCDSNFLTIFLSEFVTIFVYLLLLSMQ